MKKRLIRLTAWVVAVAVVTVVAYRSDVFFATETAFAVGDLTIDWGVTAGSPIFTETNFAPGDVETHNVLVTNSASTARPVAVRGIKTAGNGISSQLELVISNGANDLYGGTSATGAKTLADFFVDSADVSGIPLLTLAPGNNITFTFTATFKPTAGNSVQQESVTFDIKLGIGFDLPAQCESLQFSDQPIFGTSGSDNIRGTNGNDLIITFEGDDNIRSGTGDDCVLGGAGADNIRGDNGQDVLLGEEGSDNIRGDNGADIVRGGEGGDNLRGGNGDDIVEGENGPDLMQGDNGNDQLIGGAGSDQANGGRGVDTCQAESRQACEL